MPTHIPRFATQAISEALTDTRVVIVNGARQSGKSTLVHRLIRTVPGAQERKLDRPMELAAARLDPDAFIRSEALLVIDEIQRAPELILPIKATVDEDTRPGQYLLTGSARLLGLKNLPDVLAGRSETVELWPFSQAEIAQTEPNAVDAFVNGSPAGLVAGKTTRDEYFERVARGGFPEAIQRSERRRAKFFDSYVTDLVERDVTQLADIGRRDVLLQLIECVAASAGQLLVSARLASAVRVSVGTVERYLSLFEEVFLIKRLPPWTASSTPRTVSARKLLFVDSGIAANLCGRSAARLSRNDPLAGPLLENFVLSEIARLLPQASKPLRLSHFRTKDGIEVDGVLEARDGTVVGIEVKASESVRSEDLRGLIYLRDRIPERFACGLVMYAGGSIRSIGDRMWAVPIDALWNGQQEPDSRSAA